MCLDNVMQVNCILSFHHTQLCLLGWAAFPSYLWVECIALWKFLYVLLRQGFKWDFLKGIPQIRNSPVRMWYQLLATCNYHWHNFMSYMGESEHITLCRIFQKARIKAFNWTMGPDIKKQGKILNFGLAYTGWIL